MSKLSMLAMAVALAAAGCDTDPYSPARRVGGAGKAPSSSEQTEETYTILLCHLSDPVRHVQDANRYSKTLAEKLGWKGLFVVSKEGHSELFWGRYVSPAAAAKNLKTAKAHRTQTGVPIFAKAMVVLLPGVDFGPDEWRLDTAKGEYSVLVAIFKDVPDKKYVGRRRFALAYCRRLREHGYAAFFYHGKVTSHVTIGAFGAEAVRKRKTATGHEAEVVDPQMKKLREEFPELLVNGNTVTDIIRDSRTGAIVRRNVWQTSTIRIPRKRSAAPDAR